MDLWAVLERLDGTLHLNPVWNVVQDQMADQPLCPCLRIRVIRKDAYREWR